VFPEDAERLQKMLDSKNHTGVNLDLDMKTRKLTWGCRYCGTAPVLLADKCGGGAYFPGQRCSKNRCRDE
jgi:hypothetical protein